jgi:hypothetical protein
VTDPAVLVPIVSEIVYQVAVLAPEQGDVLAGRAWDIIERSGGDALAVKLAAEQEWQNADARRDRESAYAWLEISTVAHDVWVRLGPTSSSAEPER